MSFADPGISNCADLAETIHWNDDAGYWGCGVSVSGREIGLRFVQTGDVCPAVFSRFADIGLGNDASRQSEMDRTHLSACSCAVADCHAIHIYNGQYQWTNRRWFNSRRHSGTPAHTILAWSPDPRRQTVRYSTQRPCV